jgi:hypothetical protein
MYDEDDGAQDGGLKIQYNSQRIYLHLKIYGEIPQ